MSFQEFTLTNPENYCEVMVDIDTETGKVIDLYCYADHIPVIENEETGKTYKVSTKDGKNPLFVHITSKGRIYKKLLEHGFIFCLNDEDSDYQKEVSIIEKSLNLYDLSNSIQVY